MIATLNVVKINRALAALAITIVLWAVAFPAIRVAVAEYGPAALSLLRLVIASATLALAAPLLGLRRPSRRDLPLIALAGLTGMAGYQFLLTWGEVHIPAGTASLIIVTNPVYSAAIAMLFLGERMTTRQVIGAGAALVGTIAIATARGGVHFDRSTWVILAAAVAFGAYHVTIKPLLSRYSGLEVTAYATWTGTLLLLPGLPALVQATPHTTARAALAAAFLGVAPSALGFLAWSYAVARLPVITATGALYLVPPIAVGTGWLWLGENPRAIELLGGILAIASVAFANSRRRPEQTPSGTAVGRRDSCAATRHPGDHP